MLVPEQSLIIKNIPSLYAKFVATIDQGQNLTLDLSGVTEVDSSGIALLIELKQLAQKKNCILTIDNPSSAILRLCNLYKINF